MVAQYTPPEDYKSGLKEILGEAGKIYQQQKAAGYQTYQGPQIAGFAPEEQAAMRGIAGLVGTGQQYFAPATALTAGAARQFTPTEAAAYMSPYQQAVVDVEKREASRYFPQQMQQIGAQAVGAGGYGGSRQAILEAETLRNQAQQLADIQTRGSQAAFEDARKAFGEQLGRERGVASSLAQLGQTVPQQAMTELSALAGVGEAQRGMTQAGYDIARQEYERQLNFPYEALGQYQSTVYQMPLQGFARYQPVAKPSSSQNLASILGSAATIGSKFKLFSEGGHVAFRSQGGLSGLTQKLAAGSGLGSKRGYFSNMQEGEVVEQKEDKTPAGQAEKNKNALASILQALAGYQESAEKYGTTAEEVMKEQQKLSEEKQQRLENDMSPRSYIGNLLLGYGAADPELGTAGQIATATMYAEEQEQAVQNEVDKVKTELLEGKISQAEAELKLSKLGVDTAETLYDLSIPDLGMPSRADLLIYGKALFGAGADLSTNSSKIAEASLAARDEAMAIIAENPSDYKTKEAQKSLTYEILERKIQEARGLGSPNTTAVPEGTSVTGGSGSSSGSGMSADDSIDAI